MAMRLISATGQPLAALASARCAVRLLDHGQRALGRDATARLAHRRAHRRGALYAARECGLDPGDHRSGPRRRQRSHDRHRRAADHRRPASPPERRPRQPLRASRRGWGVAGAARRLAALPHRRGAAQPFRIYTRSLELQLSSGVVDVQSTILRPRSPSRRARSGSPPPMACARPR